MKKAKPAQYPILETELVTAYERGHVDSLRVIERRLGYELEVDVKPRPAETQFMSVRRNPDKPRKFQDDKALLELLTKICPTAKIHITREEPHDRKAVKASKKQRSKKR